jgi:hypothetical protein
MIHVEFDSLQPGDEVVFDGNNTVYTVLGKRFEPYTRALKNVGEVMVYLSPNDDNYIRKVGMFDADVSRMHRHVKGE